MSETNRGGRREFLRLTAGVAGVRLRLVDFLPTDVRAERELGEWQRKASGLKT